MQARSFFAASRVVLGESRARTLLLGESGASGGGVCVHVRVISMSNSNPVLALMTQADGLARCECL